MEKLIVRNYKNVKEFAFNIDKPCDKKFEVEIVDFQNNPVIAKRFSEFCKMHKYLFNVSEHFENKYRFLIGAIDYVELKDKLNYFIKDQNEIVIQNLMEHNVLQLDKNLLLQTIEN